MVGVSRLPFRNDAVGPLRVFLGDRASVLPMHGGNKQLGKGLMESIKKQLGLK
jgi:mRNA interferase HicA